MAAPDELTLNARRRQIAALLRNGLATDWRQRAYAHAEIMQRTAALQALPADALPDKLMIAGFTLSPYVDQADPEIEQSCRTCMYFEVHKRWCNLPELQLGVEPDWSCNLWRV